MTGGVETPFFVLILLIIILLIICRCFVWFVAIYFILILWYYILIVWRLAMIGYGGEGAHPRVGGGANLYPLTHHM